MKGVRNFYPSILEELKSHDPSETPGVCSRASETIRYQQDLMRRSWLIISDAIRHGMPITKEVASVRNAILNAPDMRIKKARR